MLVVGATRPSYLLLAVALEVDSEQARPLVGLCSPTYLLTTLKEGVQRDVSCCLAGFGGPLERRGS